MTRKEVNEKFKKIKSLNVCEGGCCNDNCSDKNNNRQFIGENFKILLKGLGCANCANKIEEEVKGLESIKDANLNFASTTLTVVLNDGYLIDHIKKLNR